MKLQPREQSIIGGGAILAVLALGTFGIVTDFAIFPQWNKFTVVQKQLSEINAQVATQEAQLSGLKAEKATLETDVIQMPEGKNIGKVNNAEGETFASTKRELLNTVIEMSLNHDNVLISAIPGNKPPPAPVSQDPNAPQVPQLSTYVDEIPYNITIRGNYTELNGFINELSEYDIVIEIANLTILPEGTKQGPLSYPQKPLKAEFKINYLIFKE